MERYNNCPIPVVQYSKKKISLGSLTVRKLRISCVVWHYCICFLYFFCTVVQPYLSWYVLSFDLEMACSSCPRWWFVVDSWLSQALSSSLFCWRAVCLCCFSDSRSRIALQKLPAKSENNIQSDVSCMSQVKEYLPTIKGKDVYTNDFKIIVIDVAETH